MSQRTATWKLIVTMVAIFGLVFSTALPGTTVSAAAAGASVVLPEGHILSEEELEAVTGEAANIIIGAAIGFTGHVIANGWHPTDAGWWLEAAINTAVGAVVPTPGAAVATKALEGTAKVAMSAYSHVANAVVTLGPAIAGKVKDGN